MPQRWRRSGSHSHPIPSRDAGSFGVTATARGVPLDCPQPNYNNNSRSIEDAGLNAPPSAFLQSFAFAKNNTLTSCWERNKKGDWDADACRIGNRKMCFIKCYL